MFILSYTLKKKEKLDVLKDDLLIYSDPGFMESIKKGIDDAKSGKTVKCEDRTDRKNSSSRYNLKNVLKRIYC